MWSASRGRPGRREQVTRPIALVGPMGAGKSTVAERLAALLGRPFADADAQIVRAAGMDVAGDLRE